MLHYGPQYVSSSTLLILRTTNCITTTSGIVTLEIGERSYVGNSISKLQIQVTTYVFEVSAGNCHR